MCVRCPSLYTAFVISIRIKFITKVRQAYFASSMNEGPSDPNLNSLRIVAILSRFGRGQFLSKCPILWNLKVRRLANLYSNCLNFQTCILAESLERVHSRVPGDLNCRNDFDSNFCFCLPQIWKQIASVTNKLLLLSRYTTFCPHRYHGPSAIYIHYTYVCVYIL